MGVPRKLNFSTSRFEQTHLFPLTCYYRPRTLLSFLPNRNRKRRDPSSATAIMGVQKKTRKFAQVKRVLGKRDSRLKENIAKNEALQKEQAGKRKTITGELIREAPQVPSHMFFKHNEALVPPYNVLVDTNFLSHTVQRKLSLLESMMDCLYAKCNPIITSCVMSELEKLGPKYRLALRVARDERWTRLQCDHKGTYADDCLVTRVQQNRIYIIGTNDFALKKRLRKIPGVPIMSVARGKYVVEKLPNAPDS